MGGCESLVAGVQIYDLDPGEDDIPEVLLAPERTHIERPPRVWRQSRHFGKSAPVSCGVALNRLQGAHEAGQYETAVSMQ